jgi:hypothetical protein
MKLQFEIKQMDDLDGILIGVYDLYLISAHNISWFVSLLLMKTGLVSWVALVE